ncbi:rRNA methyltransferase 1, mitochondrial [Merluccius polli]|uniref:rRNA methyltransferase 1, mitochondrial n=1 Tax=Merluccius polli TaxID=89951 RepID=A0AA47MCI9_MERPO|nr:rRNA methyltransferase 1, mitochondrial [Merluccius polli]
MGLWSNACQRGGLLSKYCCRNGLIGSRFSLYRVAAGATPCSKDGAATKRGHAGGKAAASSDGSPDRRRSGGSYQHQHRGQNKALKKGTASSDLTRLSFEDFAADSEKPVRGSVTTPVTRTTVDDRNCEVVFGVSPCLLALTSGRREAFSLLVKEGDVSHRTSVIKVCEEAHRRGVQIKRVSKKHLDRISAGRVHQGVCLQASPLSYLTEETACTESVKRSGLIPLWLVLDGVQDPMNLGAILRSAYFLGVDRVATGLHNSCPLTPVVSKASSGAMEVIDVYGYESLEKMLKSKVSQGWHVVGTVGAQAEDHSTVVTRCTDFQMTKPTLLLMGGEGEGVSRKLLPQCQTFLTIPPSRRLIPGIESLNVSVATGILLHSLLAHRAQSGS